MERLPHALLGRIGGRRGLGKGHGADETRGRGEVAGQAPHAGALAEADQFFARHHHRGRVIRAEMDVVAEVRLVPIEGRGVGDHAQRVFVDVTFGRRRTRSRRYGLRRR